MDLLLNFTWLCSDNNSQLAFRDAIGPLVGLDLYLEQSASAYIAPGADYVKRSAMCDSDIISKVTPWKFHNSNDLY